MAKEKGLPSVPRNLPRALTCYLQALQNVILSVSGLGRGTEENRAARVSEVVQKPAPALRKGSVLTGNLADESVTSEKLADGSVSAKKLAQSSVTKKAIREGAVGTGELEAFCVTSDKLGANSVTREKLAPDARLKIISGESAHGESVELGEWPASPVILLSSAELRFAAEGDLRIGIKDLRREASGWVFETEAICETKTAAYEGKIRWTAIGMEA